MDSDVETELSSEEDSGSSWYSDSDDGVSNVKRRKNKALNYPKQKSGLKFIGITHDDRDSDDVDVNNVETEKQNCQSVLVNTAEDQAVLDDNHCNHVSESMTAESDEEESKNESVGDEVSHGKKKPRQRKRNACPYCSKGPFVKISDHLKTVHKDEPDVRRIIKDYSLSLKERRKLYNIIVGRGNLKYNSEIKASNKQNFILKYKREEEVIKEDEVVPCKHCGHLYRIKSASRHECPMEYKKDRKEGEKIRIVAKSKLMWINICKMSPRVRTLMETLRNDKIAEIVVNEPSIVRFAEDKMEGIELLPHENAADVLFNERTTQLRSNLRKAATFLDHFRTASGNKELTLKQAFQPNNRHHLSNVAMLLSKQYNSPHSVSLLKTLLGHFFTMLENDAETSAESQTWMLWRKKFFYKWHNAISPRVRTAKRNLRQFGTFDIPSGEMMTKFNRFINDKLNELLTKDIRSYPEYLQLARFTFARITTFNKRRGEEVARMTMHQYRQRIKGGASTSVSNIKMSKLEMEIAKFTEVVTVKGKSAKNEAVHAILPPNCVKAIDKLLESRKKYSSLEGNDYIFGIAGLKKFHLPGTVTLRNIAMQAEVEPLEAFTAGKLRKYISTDMVWMNLDKQQKQLLASQLGHVLSIHDDVYDENMRSTTSTLHKIPALLCAYEAGLTLSKPATDVTDDDVLAYINETIKIDEDKKKKIKPKEDGAKNVDGEESSDENIDSSDASDVEDYTAPTECDVSSEIPNQAKSRTDCNPDTAIPHATPSGSGIPQKKSKWDNEENCKTLPHAPLSTAEQLETEPKKIDGTVVESINSKSKRCNGNQMENAESDNDNSGTPFQKSKEDTNKTVTGTKLQHWTDDMKRILREEFKDEFDDLRLPVRLVKLLSCQKRIFKECSRTVSTNSIKGTIHYQRKKLRN